MASEVTIVAFAPQTTAVIRGRAQISELSTVVPKYCGEVWNYVKANGIPNPGRHLALYLDDAMNIEVGVEVGQPFRGDGRVVCSSIPGGETARLTHWGSYHRLGETHTAIRDWCAANGHKLAGPNWEIYDHWSDDPAKVRTDIYYLIDPSIQ